MKLELTAYEVAELHRLIGRAICDGDGTVTAGRILGKLRTPGELPCDHEVVAVTGRTNAQIAHWDGRTRLAYGIV